jgi:hypothetical protein
MNNSFPFKSNDIIAPIPTKSNVDKNKKYLYVDSDFRQDDRFKQAVTRQKKNDKDDYNLVVNKINSFKNPSSSNDLMKSKNYKEFSKTELKDKFIYTIYNEMKDTNSEIISNDEMSRIQGITTNKIEPYNFSMGGQIANSNIYNVNGLYAPVYTMMDSSYKNI